MPTLWEILTGQDEEPDVESQFTNPLKARIGNEVRIDTLELEELHFNVRALREVTRHVGDQEFQYADYILVARPFGGDPVKKKLRLMPLDEHSDGSMTHSALLFDLLDEFEYHEDFHKGLAFEENKGEFLEGDAMYWRVNEVEAPWECTVKHISDLDGDGEVEMEEVEDAAMTYWDFWRETEDDGGNKVLEFYIVEMDNDSGWFQIWVGKEIDQHRVQIN